MFAASLYIIWKPQRTVQGNHTAINSKTNIMSQTHVLARTKLICNPIRYTPQHTGALNLIRAPHRQTHKQHSCG